MATETVQFRRRQKWREREAFGRTVRFGAARLVRLVAPAIRFGEPAWVATVLGDVVEPQATVLRESTLLAKWERVR